MASRKVNKTYAIKENTALTPNSLRELGSSSIDLRTHTLFQMASLPGNKEAGGVLSYSKIRSWNPDACLPAVGPLPFLQHLKS